MTTEETGKTTALLERISRIGQWVGVPNDLKDDLTQEAWILCSEYARAHGRMASALSTTEIRLRCFEARRKLLMPRHEMLVDDIVKVSDEITSQHSQQQDALEDMVREEEVVRYTSNAETVQWVLMHHPKLKLTPAQCALWEIYRGNPYGRWKAERARALGVTRQNVANITAVVRKKIEAAADLTRLWEGDILPFFEKYSTGWATSPIRRVVWDVLRVHQKNAVPHTMQKRFERIQSAVFAHVYERLTRHGNGSMPSNAHDLSVTYNMLITATHMSPSSSCARQYYFMLKDMKQRSWMLYRFVRRAGHLIMPEARQSHGEWLKEKIFTRDEEGRRFAQYAIAYYEGTTPAEAARLLVTDGDAIIQSVSYTPVIRRLYNNLRITRYRTGPWTDINILRVLLMQTHFPFDQYPLSLSCRNALMTICQQSLHSADAFVVSRAERMLAELVVS